jgi:hypothetical protein
MILVIVDKIDDEKTYILILIIVVATITICML